MKQYTTPEQTAKLIELGFEKPKMAAPVLKWVDGEPTFEPQYTIGELIAMLPVTIKGELLDINHNRMHWSVCYYSPITNRYRILTEDKELIDALYEMCIKLKEEGVI